MRYFCFQLTLTMLFVSGAACSIAAEKPDDPAVLKAFQRGEYRIPMRDGTRLFTVVYMPRDDSSSHPILLNRTPYNAFGNGRRAVGPSEFTMRDEYIVAYQDVRGRGRSQGTFEDVRPITTDTSPTSATQADESTDAFDTIAWLLKNVPDNDGRVGMWGMSYPGFYATCALINPHPNLLAVSPQAPIADWFLGDDAHHNGALFLMDEFYSGPANVSPRDAYDFFMNLGPVGRANPRFFHGRDQFWNDEMDHPNYDSFWKSRAILPHLKPTRIATLVTGGWFDAEDLYGAVHTHRTLEKLSQSDNHHFAMGPWRHGGWSSGAGAQLGDLDFGTSTAEYYRENIERRFFARYLEDGPTTDIARVTTFIAGENKWRTFEQWPPPAATTFSLHLKPGGLLGAGAPAAAESFTEYSADPARPVPYQARISGTRGTEYMDADQRFASRRPDVAVFQTPRLESDTTMAGPIRCDLYVSTSGTDADWVVKVIDVWPENEAPLASVANGDDLHGCQTLVRGDVMRGKFRNSHEHPEPFVPGEATRLRFELNDIGYTFKKGHRIMLQIQNSWFPLVDRNPQTFCNINQAIPAHFKKAQMKIYHDKTHDSQIDFLHLP